MAHALSTITARGNMRGLRMIMAATTTNENYATGGIAITPNTIGLNNITNLMCQGAVPLAATTLYIPFYDSSTSKIKLFWVDTTVDGAPLAEVTNGTAIGLLVYSLFAFGN